MSGVSKDHSGVSEFLSQCSPPNLPVTTSVTGTRGEAGGVTPSSSFSMTNTRISEVCSLTHSRTFATGSPKTPARTTASLNPLTGVDDGTAPPNTCASAHAPALPAGDHEPAEASPTAPRSAAVVYHPLTFSSTRNSSVSPSSNPGPENNPSAKKRHIIGLSEVSLQITPPKEEGSVASGPQCLSPGEGLSFLPPIFSPLTFEASPTKRETTSNSSASSSKHSPFHPTSQDRHVQSITVVPADRLLSSSGRVQPMSTRGDAAALFPNTSAPHLIYRDSPIPKFLRSDRSLSPFGSPVALSECPTPNLHTSLPSGQLHAEERTVHSTKTVRAEWEDDDLKKGLRMLTSPSEKVLLFRANSSVGSVKGGTLTASTPWRCTADIVSSSAILESREEWSGGQRVSLELNVVPAHTNASSHLTTRSSTEAAVPCTPGLSPTRLTGSDMLHSAALPRCHPAASETSTEPEVGSTESRIPLCPLPIGTLNTHGGAVPLSCTSNPDRGDTASRPYWCKLTHPDPTTTARHSVIGASGLHLTLHSRSSSGSLCVPQTETQPSPPPSVTSVCPRRVVLRSDESSFHSPIPLAQHSPKPPSSATSAVPAPSPRPGSSSFEKILKVSPTSSDTNDMVKSSANSRFSDQQWCSTPGVLSVAPPPVTSLRLRSVSSTSSSLFDNGGEFESLRHAPAFALPATPPYEQPPPHDSRASLQNSFAQRGMRTKAKMPQECGENGGDGLPLESEGARKNKQLEGVLFPPLLKEVEANRSLERETTEENHKEPSCVLSSEGRKLQECEYEGVKQEESPSTPQPTPMVEVFAHVDSPWVSITERGAKTSQCDPMNPEPSLTFEKQKAEQDGTASIVQHHNGSRRRSPRGLQRSITSIYNSGRLSILPSMGQTLENFRNSIHNFPTFNSIQNVSSTDSEFLNPADSALQSNVVAHLANMEQILNVEEHFASMEVSDTGTVNTYWNISLEGSCNSWLLSSTEELNGPLEDVSGSMTRIGADTCALSPVRGAGSCISLAQHINNSGKGSSVLSSVDGGPYLFNVSGAGSTGSTTSMRCPPSYMLYYPNSVGTGQTSTAFYSGSAPNSTRRPPSPSMVTRAPTRRPDQGFSAAIGDLYLVDSRMWGCGSGALINTSARNGNVSGCSSLSFSSPRRVSDTYAELLHCSMADSINSYPPPPHKTL